MSALLFQLVMTITQCVWTSVSEIGMDVSLSALLFQLVMTITQCVWTSVTEIGADVYNAVSPCGDGEEICED